MSAALLQYQACLGIMLRLQVEDLSRLKGDFDRFGRGLSLREFVSVMLDRVSWEPATVVPFVEDLIELFAQVDVNGDGSMEWEEFTSAIIEGGMGTADDDAAAEWRDLQYEESARFVDAAVNRPPKRIQFLPEFRRLLLFDDSRPVVELLDPAGLIPPETDDSKNSSGGGGSGGGDGNGLNAGDEDEAECGGSGGVSGSAMTTFVPQLPLLNKFHPLCYVAGYRRDQDDVRSERSPVQALKYLDGQDLLVVSAGDLKLTFWPTTLLTAASSSALETPMPIAVVHTPRPQRVLEWNAATRHLFSISADLIISVWGVTREKSHDASKARCEVRLVTTLKKHTDLLQDLLLLNPETLLSCGMDSVIYVWDAVTLTPRASRQGHRRGVRLLTKLSNQVFLSAGFECEIYGWDISPLAVAPVFKLWGHNAPVCCIQLIPSASFLASARSSTSSAEATAMLADQAITVDDDGWFKWWNLANVLSMESSDLEKSSSRCLQSFRLGSDKYPWRAHSLAVLHHGQSVLAAGLHKLKLLQRVRLKPKVLASSVVLYNSVSLTLLTTTDRELRVWDAASGALLRTYRNISTSDITCVDLDARQRKIVFGAQNGELTVINYLNGAVLNRWTPHQLQVAALIYCKEDQCVLTASWDRSLRLYDDNAKSNPLLRCVTDAHDSDIKCLAYCYAMGVFASGSADGVVKIWDYIYFFLEDACSPPPRERADGSTASLTATQGHGDVNVLEFVDPYPLLVSGHESGLVCVWSLSTMHLCSLLVSFFPFQLCVALSPAEDADGEPSDGQRSKPRKESSISCCRAFFDERGGDVLAQDIRRGQFLLIAGNSIGELSVCDVSRVVFDSHVRAFREENMPSRDDRSYNPRRRFLRQGKHAKRLKGKHEHVALASPVHNAPQVSEEDVALLVSWRGHRGNIRSLQVVDEPRGILTCSSDKTVKVWAFDGQCLGDLTGEQSQQTQPTKKPPQEQEDPDAPRDYDGVWKWEVDDETVSRERRLQAEQIWDQLKESKLKDAAARQQSILIAKREKRRSTAFPMATSSSVPVLGRSTSQIGLGASASTPSVSLLSVDEQPESQANAGPNNADRLFDQLRGRATWKLSDVQRARQTAWERERKKFRQRMKRIMKSKARGQSGSLEGEADNQVDEDDAAGGNGHGTSIGRLDDIPVLHEEEDILPALEHPTDELPFDDKDNWAVGSLNRERQMYTHMHHENVRRNSKAVAGSSSALRLKRLNSSLSQAELAPSSFLLEKLGPSCVIREHVERKPPVKRRSKLASGLGKAQSMSALPRPQSGRPRSGGGAAASQALGNVLQEHTIKDRFQHYDQLLAQQEDEEEKFIEEMTARAASSARSPDPTERNTSRDPGQEDTDPLLPPDDSTESSQPSDASKSLSQADKHSAGNPKTRSQGARKSPRSKAMEPASTKTHKGGKENAKAKKQRLRSDAALMRQERFGPYSRDDVVNLYRTFRKLDQDRSGSITLQELFGGAGLFAGTHMQDNVMSIFSSVDEDQSGQIDLPELCRAVFSDAASHVLDDILRLCSLLDAVERTRKAKKKTLTPDQLEELEAIFKVRRVATALRVCMWMLTRV